MTGEYVFAILVGLLILLSVLALFRYMRRKAYPAGIMLLYTTILLFCFSFTLLFGGWLLEKISPEPQFAGTALIDALLLFGVWYFYVPLFFLYVTVVYFLVQLVRKAARSRK